jgi:hypothetical protein
MARHAIAADIAKAKANAAKVSKPLINTEIGCIARANPTDSTGPVQDHSGRTGYSGRIG